MSIKGTKEWMPHNENCMKDSVQDLLGITQNGERNAILAAVYYINCPWRGAGNV